MSSFQITDQHLHYLSYCCVYIKTLGASFSVGRRGRTLTAVTSSRSSSQPLGRRWRHRASFPNNAQEKATLTIQTEVRSTFSARLVQESNLRRSTRLLPADSVLPEDMSSPPKDKVETKGGHAPAGKRWLAPPSCFRSHLAPAGWTQVTIMWGFVTLQQSVRFTGSTRRHRVFTASLPLAFLYFLRRWRGRRSRAGWG